MTKVEKIAKEFVNVWRQKITAKEKRRKCVINCVQDKVEEIPGSGWEHTGACFRRLPEDEYCEHCQKGLTYHREFNRLSASASGLLRRLENAVKNL